MLYPWALSQTDPVINMQMLYDNSVAVTDTRRRVYEDFRMLSELRWAFVYNSVTYYDNL